MVNTITYSLRLDQPDSDAFYRAVSAYARDWLAGALPQAAETITGFRQYRLGGNLPDRSDAEYAFELLALGVLLREHGQEASSLPDFAIRSLNSLLKIQERWPRSESLVKVLRGWVGWLGRHSRRSSVASPDPLGRIILLQRATSEDGRAERLAQWQAWCLAGGAERTGRVLSLSQTLAEEFAVSSQQALGRFTENVEPFIRTTAPHHRANYDYEFIARTRLEYHLGMLGTEILDQAYRARFLATGQKIVIVPPCMRALPEEECKAVALPFGSLCQACTPSCRVNQVTKLGEKEGFKVFIMPDELRVFGTGGQPGSLGVVGVSCALTNWSGGWDAAELGVPAQGVLLDYVGCKYHWHPTGIPTDTNFKRLRDVLAGRESQ